MNRFLNAVEFVGNKLPHPFFLFIFLALFIVLLSAILHFFGVETINPQDGKVVAIKSLLDASGVEFLFSSAIKNFVSFPPLGLIFMIMIGMGLAEKVGLISACIRLSVLRCPKSLLTFSVFMIGSSSSIASDASYFIVIPLAAMLYHSFGRHPIAGAVAGYAATGGVKDASVFITSSDALLSGIATDAARVIDPNFVVLAVDNYYFALASCFVISIAGSIIIDYFIEPRLVKSLPVDKGVELPKLENLSCAEKRALKWSFFTFAVIVALFCLILYPQDSPLRGPNGSLIPSVFLKNIATVIFIFCVSMGIVYGVGVGKIKKLKDIPDLIAQAIKDLVPTLVLFFAIAQFLAYFKYSNLTLYIAIEGSNFLKTSGFVGYEFMLSFIVLCAFLNIFMTSGSAQWSLMAPIFVPMLMYVDYHPAFTMAMFKIGDSVTNIISPCSPYFGVALLFMQKYKKDMGIGTLISTMLPISLTLLLVWSVLLVIFVMLNLDFGPGIGVYLS